MPEVWSVWSESFRPQDGNIEVVFTSALACPSQEHTVCV